jgi:stage V sporulation protein R
VWDGNYKNRGELYLKHDFNGVELKTQYATDTLVNLHRLWGRPVHIETTLSDETTVLSYDGTQHHSRVTDAPPAATKQ